MVSYKVPSMQDFDGFGKSGPLIKSPNDYTIDHLLEDDVSRLWLYTLPPVLRPAVTRPLNESEIQTLRVKSRISCATPVAGRRPKLVIQMGCAGAGKSSRAAECYELFGVEESNIVLADGDLVRESHAELTAILDFDKKALLQRLQDEGHSSMYKVYSEQTKDVPDGTPIGFQDCGTWCYASSAGMKEALAREALRDRKDVMLAVTAAKTVYVNIIKDAVAQGYEVHVAAFLVRPSILLQRQVIRATGGGRLPTIDKLISDGNLYWNTVLKQQKVIEGLPMMLEIARGSGGTAIVFNNTPDFRKEPMLPPIFADVGYGQPKCNFPGETDVEGLIHYLQIKLQRTPPYVKLCKPKDK